MLKEINRLKAENDLHVRENLVIALIICTEFFIYSKKKLYLTKCKPKARRKMIFWKTHQDIEFSR